MVIRLRGVKVYKKQLSNIKPVALLNLFKSNFFKTFLIFNKINKIIN